MYFPQTQVFIAFVNYLLMFFDRILLRHLSFIKMLSKICKIHIFFK